jgi:hypothetical protein
MWPGCTSAELAGSLRRNSTAPSSSSGGTTTTTRSAGYSFSGQPGSSTASKGTHIPARVACCSAAVGSRAVMRVPGRACTSVTGSAAATIDPTPLRRVMRPSSASMASARCAVSLETEYSRASCGSLGTRSPGPSRPLRIRSRSSCASWADSGHTDAGSTFMRGAYRNLLPGCSGEGQVSPVSQRSSRRGRIAGLSGETCHPPVSWGLRFDVDRMVQEPWLAAPCPGGRDRAGCGQCGTGERRCSRGSHPVAAAQLRQSTALARPSAPNRRRATVLTQLPPGIVQRIG